MFSSENRTSEVVVEHVSCKGTLDFNTKLISKWSFLFLFFFILVLSTVFFVSFGRFWFLFNVWDTFFAICARSLRSLLRGCLFVSGFLFVFGSISLFVFGYKNCQEILFESIRQGDVLFLYRHIYVREAQRDHSNKIFKSVLNLPAAFSKWVSSSA